jgi:hypothetical protein
MIAGATAAFQRRFSVSSAVRPTLSGSTEWRPDMKYLLLILAAGASAAVFLALTSSPERSPAAPAAPPAHPPSVFYGHIKSMTETAPGRYELQLDPAWWLAGVAAQHAALESTGSSDVPNDYVTVDESHRLLTFPVLDDAQVALLTGAAEHTTISVGELAEIVNGRNPRQRGIFEPDAGWWLQIGEQYPNPAVVLFQQYQP